MIARLLYGISFIVIAAVVTIAGVRMWHDARARPAPIPVAVAVAPDGWISLAGDRHTIDRVTAPSNVRWSALAPDPVDNFVVTSPLVLAIAPASMTAVELESGAVHFTWKLPAGETWAPQPPVLFGTCLIAMTVQAGDSHVRCLDKRTGVARWVATIAGGRGCVEAPRWVRGAYIVQCEGWTSVIDEATGAVTVDAGGRGIVQLDPPFLLRASPSLEIAPWFEAEHRFAKVGEPVLGTTGFIGPSAVQRWDRLIVRASSASDKLAVISPRAGHAVVVASSDLHLADDTPFVLSCGGAAPPRFQLLALAPKLTAKFDPELAQQRAYGLLDVEHGTLAWNSRTFVPVLAQSTRQLCVAQHYLVPIEIRMPGGESESALWIIDAELGTTIAVVAFDADSGQVFDQLTENQVDAHRVVGIGPTGAYVFDWTAPLATAGTHDARGDVEAVLGRLP